MGAVLASIAAVAVGTGGAGDFNELTNLQTENMLGQFTESPTGFLNQQNNEKSTKPVTITAEIDNTSRIEVESRKMILRNVSKISSDKRIITSNENITLNNFSGEIIANNNAPTQLRASTSGFKSSGVEVKQETELDAKSDAKIIALKHVRDSSLSLKPAYTKIESRNSSTVIEKEKTSLEINSFTGNMTYFHQNSSFTFKGSIVDVKAGQVSFGS